MNPNVCCRMVATWIVAVRSWSWPPLASHRAQLIGHHELVGVCICVCVYVCGELVCMTCSICASVIKEVWMCAIYIQSLIQGSVY